MPDRFSARPLDPAVPIRDRWALVDSTARFADGVLLHTDETTARDLAAAANADPSLVDEPGAF